MQKAVEGWREDPMTRGSTHKLLGEESVPRYVTSFRISSITSSNSSMSLNRWFDEIRHVQDAEEVFRLHNVGIQQITEIKGRFVSISRTWDFAASNTLHGDLILLRNMLSGQFGVQLHATLLTVHLVPLLSNVGHCALTQSFNQMEYLLAQLQPSQ